MNAESKSDVLEEEEDGGCCCFTSGEIGMGGGSIASGKRLGATGGSNVETLEGLPRKSFWTIGGGAAGVTSFFSGGGDGSSRGNKGLKELSGVGLANKLVFPIFPLGLRLKELRSLEDGGATIELNKSAGGFEAGAGADDNLLAIEEKSREGFDLLVILVVEAVEPIISFFGMVTETALLLA